MKSKISWKIWRCCFDLEQIATLPADTNYQDRTDLIFVADNTGEATPFDYIGIMQDYHLILKYIN